VFKIKSTHAFAPGFRLSVLDMAVLTVGVTAAFALASAVFWWGIMFGFVLGHFFLFCNVVRMTRPLELAWAAVFVFLAAATIALGTPGWRATVSLSLFATVTVVVLQIRKPSYHGAGWRWINPDLPNWWEHKESQSADG
jgi:hypothetical protein